MWSSPMEQPDVLRAYGADYTEMTLKYSPRNINDLRSTRNHCTDLRLSRLNTRGSCSGMYAGSRVRVTCWDERLF